MKKVSIFLFLMLIILLTSLPAFADPFSDVPSDHWAYDAVQMLEEKGLVEGYPDGLFKGDRPMTRYEMAMVVARVMAKLEQVQASIPEMPDLSIYATKKDLETINKLIEEFRSELDALGIRVNNIEDSLGKLTSRVEELERISVSGRYSSVSAAVGIQEDVIQNTGPGAINSLTNTVIGDLDRYSGSTLMHGTQNALAFAPIGGNPAFYNYGTLPLYRVARIQRPFWSSAGEPEFALNEGFAFTSKLDLTVSARLSDNIQAGGDLAAYSAFGDYGVYNNWGVVPQYNTLGAIAGLGPANVLDFQADLATLWFDADGDWDITGKFGNFNLSRVSPNLFYGVRNPFFGFYDTDVLPLNGANFSGRLYNVIDLEVFYAQDINTIANGQSGYWFLSDPLDAVTSVTGNIPSYRNRLQGFWGGYDTQGKDFHIEGSFLRIYEDGTSNPTGYLSGDPVMGLLTRAEQDQIMYGFKGNYKMLDDRLMIYGEWNRSEYRASLKDKLDRQGGNLFQIGADVTFLDNMLEFYGEYVRTDPNYDPFGYHQTWERAYRDGHHDGWDDMTGLGFAVRPGKFRPNRHGIDLGLTLNLDGGEIYFDFSYLTQINSTQRIDGSEEGFNFTAMPALVAGSSVGGYGLIMGRPDLTLLNSSPYNFMGNQDYFFLFDSPNKGKEYFIEMGAEYDFREDLHFFGGWDYMKFKREYAAPTMVNGVYVEGYNNNNGRTDQNGFLPGETYFNIDAWGDTDYSAMFGHFGLTYDVTDKFSVQGSFAYARFRGVTDYGYRECLSVIVPGVAVRYKFNNVTSLVIDYKYFDTNCDIAPGNTNDYNANKLITRFNVEF